METQFDTTPASVGIEVLDSTSFDSEADAYEFLERLRWGANGPTQCPHCGSDKGAWFLKPKDPNGRLAKGGSTSRSHRRVWKCRENSCRRQFSVLTHTVMHATKMPVRVWVGAIVDLCQSKEGVSARDIATRWDVTEKSAWAMLTRIEDAITSVPVDGEHRLSAAVKWLEVSAETGAGAAESRPPTAPPAAAMEPERARILPTDTPAERVIPAQVAPVKERFKGSVSGAVVGASTAPVPQVEPRDTGAAYQVSSPPQPAGERTASPNSDRNEAARGEDSTAPVGPSTTPSQRDRDQKTGVESAAAQVKSDVERALAEAFAEPAMPQNDGPVAASTGLENVQDTGFEAPAEAHGRPSPPPTQAAGWSEKPNKRRVPPPEKTAPDAASAEPALDEEGPPKKAKKSKRKLDSERAKRQSEGKMRPSERPDAEGSGPPKASPDRSLTVQPVGGPRPSQQAKKLKNKPPLDRVKPGSDGAESRPAMSDAERSAAANAARYSSLSVQPPRGSGRSEKSEDEPTPGRTKPESAGGNTRPNQPDFERIEPTRTARDCSLSVQSPAERGCSEKPKKRRRPSPATRPSTEAKADQGQEKHDNRAPGTMATSVPQPVDNLSDAPIGGEVRRHRPPPAQASAASPAEVASEQPKSPQAPADELGGGWLDGAPASPFELGNSVSREQGQLAGIGLGVLGPTWADLDHAASPPNVIVNAPPPDQLDLFSGDLNHGV